MQSYERATRLHAIEINYLVVPPSGSIYVYRFFPIFPRFSVIFNDRRISVARDRLEREIYLSGTRPCSFVRPRRRGWHSVRRTRIRNCREEGEGMGGRRCLERFRIERSLIYGGRWRASINEILTSAANVTTVCRSNRSRLREDLEDPRVEFLSQKKKKNICFFVAFKSSDRIIDDGPIILWK